MRLTPDADRVRAAATAPSTSNITAAEFDRFVAKVKADAIREIADAVELIDPAWDSALFVDGSYHPLPDWLRARADKLATS